MAQIGKFNELKVIKHVDFGFYLDAEEMGEILLPKKYAPKNLKIDDTINVFLYHDSEDRPVATTKKPAATVGEFAYLKVAALTRFGAFLDWGLPKDLFVPFNQQTVLMEKNYFYVVYIYVDEKTGRLAATEKIEKYLSKDEPDYEFNQAVDLLVYRETDMGFKAIIDNKHTGVLYHNELLSDLRIGQRLTGYVKKIREDGKIDLSQQEMGYKKIDAISQKFITILTEHGGSIDVCDKSDPDLIFNIFGESKKTYKKTVGLLYKEHLVKLDNDKLTLVEAKQHPHKKDSDRH